MPQRKCGTCKYFEEGGIAASGWCRHPERQDLQFMVLVRKTELACRNGWNEDLWEPAEGYSDSDEFVAGAAQTGAVARNPSREIPDISDGSRSTAGQTVDSGAADTIQHGSIGSRAGKVSSDFRSSQQPENSRLAANGTGGNSYRPPSNRNRYQSEEAIDESPVLASDQPPWLVEMRRRQLEQRREVNAPSPPVLDSEEPSALDTFEQDAENHSARLTQERDVESDQYGARFDQAHTDQDEQGISTATGIESPHQSGSTEPFDFHDQAEPEDEYNPDSEEVDAIPVMAERPSLPTRVRDIPVCCRTCRDFRPVEDGARGWCTNRHAFEQRRTVRADQVGCQGSIGNFWTPSDEWWLQQADISHHGTPTPLVDEFLRDLRDRTAGRRDRKR